MTYAPKEQEPGKSFNFKEELARWWKETEVVNDYYQAELRMHKDLDQIQSQVSRKVLYQSLRQNTIEDNDENSAFPQTFKTRCQIIAPPIVPFVVDEEMPDQLSSIVKSNDPSKAPSFEELKCAELSIDHESIFLNNRRRKDGEIYRIDLTQNKPILYKKVPIPINEQQSRNQSKHENKNLAAIIDFLEPTAKFKYIELDIKELERITQVINQCREVQQHSQVKL